MELSPRDGRLHCGDWRARLQVGRPYQLSDAPPPPQLPPPPLNPLSEPPELLDDPESLELELELEPEYPPPEPSATMRRAGIFESPISDPSAPPAANAPSAAIGWRNSNAIGSALIAPNA